MEVKAGARFKYGKGSILQVFSVKQDRVKFKIFGLAFPMSGTMRLQEFFTHYVGKSKS